MHHNPPVPSTLEARVADHCRRHGLLPSGRPVLAMVSGGADSTCLMHLLARIHDGPVGVLAVDHGLRAESRARGGRRCARPPPRSACRAHVERLGMAPGAGVQERARAGRMEAAARVAREHGYARIATGHTASDQAETVLFRLARGTGRTGALGMAPRRDELVRPLLCATAAETRALVRRAGPRGGRGSRRTPTRPTPAPGSAPGCCRPWRRSTRAPSATWPPWRTLLRDEAELLEPLVEAAWAPGRATARASTRRPSPPSRGRCGACWRGA